MQAIIQANIAKERHSPETAYFRNVINLRKRTMPDIITPLYRVKIFGIALDMKSS